MVNHAMAGSINKFGVLMFNVFFFSPGEYRSVDNRRTTEVCRRLADLWEGMEEDCPAHPDPFGDPSPNARTEILLEVI